MKKAKKQPEGYIQDAILEWLMWQEGVVIFPQKKVAVKRGGYYLKGKGNEHARSIVWRLGVPDILVWSQKHHLLIGLEVKTPEGVVSNDQLSCLKDLKNKGAVCAIVRSVDDVQNLFRTITCPV